MRLRSRLTLRAIAAPGGRAIISLVRKMHLLLGNDSGKMSGSLSKTFLALPDREAVLVVIVPVPDGACHPYMSKKAVEAP